MAFIGLSPNGCFAQKIDRKAVVDRHRVVISRLDTLGSLTVGNGRFAFTVDATGLQSFPEYYAHGVPLGTQSEWGWHSFPNKENYRASESLETYTFNDKKGLYAVPSKKPGRQQQAADYFRQNPHRLQLGAVGLDIVKKDGSLVKPSDLQNIHQELNVWTGEIRSAFTIEGTPISVTTCADAGRDAIAVRITSDLLNEKRIKIRFRFPYPTNAFADVAANYTNEAAHQTNVTQPSPLSARFSRQLDTDRYSVAARWNKAASIQKVADHHYTLLPAGGTSFETSVQFSSQPASDVPEFATVRNSSVAGWEKFWLSGAAIDFAGSTDPRATELERRVVLSQYLTRVQCAGNFPPQETGLTYNSWFGKPHMEMYWWHAAHYALWGRTDLLEKSMGWYFTAFDGAEQIAKRQGFRGVRWQKMTDDTGGETASSVGSFLIWQQPHVIYLAELIYRNKPSKAVLQQYQKLVFATADFMASFAHYDPAEHRYNLGKGIIPAQECYDPAQTFNSPYELAYWKWALQVAQRWRTRLDLPTDKNWQDVVEKLAPLAQKDGVYQAAESVEDSYSPTSKYTIDHPAVLAALSTLPPNGVVDTTVMHRTYDVVENVWHWDHTWGWDFPMVAMTATRLNQPAKAVDVLFKKVTTNTYLVNGHNYQDKRLTLYLPGNGSLLSAIALMCAGYDGNKISSPGFPKTGQWTVKWEGLKPMP
ncbi:hypothetical protein IC230_31545 [Spirosoma sp. BT704]|uniref:Glycoside hydrolase family 65 n=1 Tax=Spirosoma validum TaxID=2771355 RepID=A0A927B820_9BACT|nr:hypothetical protein [Spirosoma validum]